MAKTKQSASSTKARQEQPTWFDRLSNTRKDLVCVAVLYILVLVLFHKIIFNNMIFSDAGDTAAALSWATAGEHLKTTEGIEPQWFPYVFSGMPSFGSLAYIPRNINYLQSILHSLGKLLFLNVEMSWLVLHYFLAGIFMFSLLRFWGFRQAPSLLGAMSFALSPYAVGLAGGGHGSKLMALSYLPLVFLLTHALLQRRDLLSLGLFSAAIGTLFLTNHVQMVFYVLLVVGLYSFYETLLEIRSSPLRALQKGAFLLLGLALGFAISAYVYLSVEEYAQFSIRGGGEVGVAGGLGYDYATNWSFHPFEILNLFIPAFFGFRTPYYWGWMPFTESSVYIGLLPLILAAFALIYRRNKTTLFFGLLSVVLFLISFGKHFPILYDFLFTYLPHFDKFRTPSMILHLLPFTFGILAAYGMSFLLEIPDHEREIHLPKLKKSLLIILLIIGAILVIGFLGGGILYDSLSGFMLVKEEQMVELRAQYGQQAGEVLEQLKKIRFDLLWNGRDIPGLGYIWNGYVRFALFAGAGLSLILLYLNRRLKASLFSATMVILLAIDLLVINANFIHPRPKTALKQRFRPDETIQFLKSDSSLYRIFPLGELFQDNTYMYHLIQSIGGYSPAKIKIYQEILDSCMFRGWEENFPLNMNIVNMLNTKYLLSLGKLPEEKFKIAHIDQASSIVTSLNPAYLPRAFFVDEALITASKTETFSLLNSPSFNPRRQAILEKEPTPMPAKPDTSLAVISGFLAHEITIEAFTDRPSLLVLSEVYFPKGWKSFVDGKETEIYKTNYIIRSVVVPEGKHTVVFRYHYTTYDRGLLVSSAAWGICFLSILIGGGSRVWKQRSSLLKSRGGLLS